MSISHRSVVAPLHGLTTYHAQNDLSVNSNSGWRDYLKNGKSLQNVTVHSVVQTSKSIAKRFLLALLPQPLTSAGFREISNNEIRPTSWMDGLRGFAAIAVFNEHYFYNFTHTIVVGWGWSPKDRWIHQLPGFELLCDGNTAVILFFTISGYVCSYQALQRITRKDHEGLFKTFPASVFRRFFRLYLPPMCSLLCIEMIAYIGLYEPTRPYFNEKEKWFPGPGSEPQPTQFPTLYLQLAHWWGQVLKMLNFWTEMGGEVSIDYHVWTIVYEFRSSMQLFVALLGLATCKPWARIFWLLVLAYVNAILLQHWEGLCFYGGAVIAQFDILRNQRRLQGTEGSNSRPKSVIMRAIPYALDAFNSQTCRTLGYFLAIYLMSYPCRGDMKGAGPLYEHIITPLIPDAYFKNKRHKFPRQVGILILLSLLTSVPLEARARSWWHRILTAKWSLYLGKIMFANYLVHGMVCHVFGYVLPFVIFRHIGGREELGRYMLGLMSGFIITLAVTIWAADAWCTHVEHRCVRFTKWLENLCFDTDSPHISATKET